MPSRQVPRSRGKPMCGQRLSSAYTCSPSRQSTSARPPRCTVLLPVAASSDSVAALCQPLSALAGAAGRVGRFWIVVMTEPPLAWCGTCPSTQYRPAHYTLLMRAGSLYIGTGAQAHGRSKANYQADDVIAVRQLDLYPNWALGCY